MSICKHILKPGHFRLMIKKCNDYRKIAEDVEKILEKMEELSEGNDFASYKEWDAGFYRYLVSKVGNQYLTDTYQRIEDKHYLIV